AARCNFVFLKTSGSFMTRLRKLYEPIGLPLRQPRTTRASRRTSTTSVGLRLIKITSVIRLSLWDQGAMDRLERKGLPPLAPRLIQACCGRLSVMSRHVFDVLRQQIVRGQNTDIS